MLAPDLLCGGVVDAPGREMHPDAIELARFAVAEHNSKTVRYRDDAIDR